MTAYEMRSSDWSSDVCSSDLVLQVGKDDQIAAARQTTCHVVELGPDAWGVHVKQDDRPRAFTVRTGYEHVGVSVGKRQNLLLAHARSEEHTSELRSLMRISYAVFCLKKQKNTTTTT